MAKPTRKHPALDSLEDSPQGLEFLGLVTRYLGAFQYEPLATFDKGRRHLFTLTGPGGTGILSEAWEEPEGAEARPIWAFYANLPSGLELHLECTGRRWSTGSEIAVTGADPFPGVSGKKRKELEGERRREIAASHDRVTTSPGSTSVGATSKDAIAGPVARSTAVFVLVGAAVPVRTGLAAIQSTRAASGGRPSGYISPILLSTSQIPGAPPCGM